MNIILKYNHRDLLLRLQFTSTSQCKKDYSGNKKHQTVRTANKISKKWLKENLLARFGETLVNRSIIQ